METGAVFREGVLPLLFLNFLRGMETLSVSGGELLRHSTS